MLLELMDKISCTICSRSFDTERSRISHDNKVHGGRGTKSQNFKWCNGCKSYRDKEEFYKLNEGVYSTCKECSGEDKDIWVKTTTKGFIYKKKYSPSNRYSSLINWAKKRNYTINLTKEQYLNMLNNEKCNCGSGFQGIAFCDVYQPNVGLTLGNTLFQCAICYTKHKYNLK